MSNRVLLTAVMLLAAGQAQATDKEEAYQQCLLQYQSKVEVPEAAILVRSACDKVHRGGVMLPRKKAYWQCVLDYVAPVKTAEVIQDLVNVCRKQHDFRK